MFPTTPRDSDAWDDDVSREIARSAPGRSGGGFYAGDRPGEHPADDDDELEEEVRFVPVRRQLSIAIAGFAALLGAGLILGAQTSGPDSRLPYAIVVLGVQALYVLAFTMAIRPPAAGITAAVSVVAGAAADYVAVTTEPAGVLRLFYVLGAAFVVALIGQTIRPRDRLQLRDALGGTFLVVLGVVAFATLLVLTRKPTGAQSVLVCLTAVGIAVFAGHLTDAIWPKPRIAPQVPRGAAGVVLGAMLGTLAAAALGSVLVLPFTPAKGAILGFVAAGIAALVDLAVNFSEAGRTLAGEAPTFWVARHMQGPLGAFSLSLPVTYILTVTMLS
ncbi:hypothetical protein [Actinoplanes sp. N902-109]|uniref:hypothetical protein n=1 Tax=Actinoplanes sp. (strain N902-109) TaxID=649831 RepID=UPI0003296547|nr:hypothetical protein [Actinoplanes sp. N902-109]AGL21264.1 hypothetical protein L083_7754 [Actinoplanes sp. N902-109]